MRAIVVAASLTVAATLFSPAAAHAATPCWQRVLDDWRDGRIDGEYAVPCYREALRHLPEDLRVYGTAEADIQRALTRELAERATQPRTKTPAATTQPRATPRPTVTTRPQRHTQQRTLAIDSPKPKVRRAAAPAPARTAGKNGFALKLVVVLGLAALATVAAIAVGRAAAVRRRGY